MLVMEQIVHGTEIHMTDYWPVGHTHNIIWAEAKMIIS